MDDEKESATKACTFEAADLSQQWRQIPQISNPNDPLANSKICPDNASYQSQDIALYDIMTAENYRSFSELAAEWQHRTGTTHASL